jgi:hypothetical protein
MHSFLAEVVIKIDNIKLQANLQESSEFGFLMFWHSYAEEAVKRKK